MPRGKRKKRPRYVRRSRAKQKTGWSLAELARLSATHPRTIRFYLARGLMPRPKFEGRATRYHRQQLVALLAIRRVQAGKRTKLEDVSASLAQVSAADFEAFALAEASPEALAALGVAPPPTVEGAAAAAGAREDSAGMTGPIAWSRWFHIDLAPGLVLVMHCDAGPDLRALASDIRNVVLAKKAAAETKPAGG
jgi:DNA-binding transcriptional MerR regulator